MQVEKVNELDKRLNIPKKKVNPKQVKPIYKAVGLAFTQKFNTTA